MLDQIEQAPWRGHHHIGTAAQGQHLRIDGDTAKHHGCLGLGGQVLRQAAHHFTDLRRQLARGHQHQRAYAPGCVAGADYEALQQRQHIGGGLAGSGLGGGEHVTPAEHGRNRSMLNGGGGGEAEFGRGLGEGGREAQSVEWHGVGMVRPSVPVVRVQAGGARYDPAP
ncbi:hypothetical protein D9M68_763540 [compost metagenome]